MATSTIKNEAIIKRTELHVSGTNSDGFIVLANDSAPLPTASKIIGFKVNANNPLYITPLIFGNNVRMFGVFDMSGVTVLKLMMNYSDSFYLDVYYADF